MSFSHVSHELANFSSIAFETAKNPYAWASMALAPVVWTVAYKDKRRPEPETELAGVSSGDDALAHEVLIDTIEDRSETVAPRWREPKTIAAGGFVVGLSLLNPTFEHDVPVPDAAVVIAAQDSTSMRLTADMDDETRRLSVQNGVRLAMPSMPEDLLAGVVNFGNNAATDLGLSTDRDYLLDAIDAQTPDPTEPDMVGAVRAVDDIFEGYTGSDSEAAIFITDGLVADAEEAATDISELAAKGIDVSVVITGEDDSSYKRTAFDENSIPSGVEAAAFEKANLPVIRATDNQEVAEAIEQIIDETTLDTERKPSKLAEMLRLTGVVAGFAGFALWLRRSWKRQV